MMAAKIIVDRLVPVRKSVPFSMPRIEGEADLKPAVAAILDAVSEGALTPGEAKEFSEIVQKFARTICDRHKRLPELQATDERLRRLTASAFYESEK
jgi:hypothetical protein